MTAPRRRLLGATVALAAAMAGVGAWTFRDDGSIKGDCMLTAADVDLSPLDRVSEATWSRLGQMRIFFGHQSVGFNIIAGLEDIQKRKPRIRLNIVETRDPAALTQGVFAQCPIGRNQHPDEKIDDFAKVLEGGIGGRADIALFKLCYIDFNSETDVASVFQRYRETMSRLQAANPGMTLIDATVPLTTVERGAKSRIKAMLGRTLHGYDENEKRAQYNDMVRGEAKTAARPLLDLARIESTLPDGVTASFKVDGRSVPCLAECYTNDGGHLNEAGRMIAARDMLLTFAEIIQRKDKGRAS
jgi:hypothetical protein